MPWKRLPWERAALKRAMSCKRAWNLGKMYIVLCKVSSQVAEQAKMSKKNALDEPSWKGFNTESCWKIQHSSVEKYNRKCTPVSIGNPEKISIYIEIRPPCWNCRSLLNLFNKAYSGRGSQGGGLDKPWISLGGPDWFDLDFGVGVGWLKA